MESTEIQKNLATLKNWNLGDDQKTIWKFWVLKNYHQVMAFLNAIAFISHRENHHPDITFGYNSCRISYTTHAIDGLSENDFICAAKIDALED